MNIIACLFIVVFIIVFGMLSFAPFILSGRLNERDRKCKPKKP